ncbi:hypothetical protein QTP86_020735, partial [Hemibagrus guttatus]
GRNWSDALAYCRATYTDLAIIENQDYMNRFLSDSQKQQLNSSAWIGLYNDINSWRWSFGNEPLGGIIRKYQIVKLKMRSSQDVNDPAVKAAILEQ